MNNFNISPCCQIISCGKVHDSVSIRNKVNQVKTAIFPQKCNSPVGVYCPKNEWRIICILALLQLGIPYVPIEIGTPQKRINYILDNCGVEMVITFSADSSLFNSIKVLLLDNIDKQECYINENEYENVLYSKLAYILYTSGTTGRPKGVKVTRENLINFVSSFTKVIPFQEVSRVLCLTNYTFDIFFVEAILPIILGKTVILANELECENPKAIVKLIKHMSVDFVQMTPTRILYIKGVDPSFSFFTNVRNILVGGESIPENLLENLLTHTNANIFNLYGPTETTIWATCSNLTKNSYVNIGRPLEGTHIYLSKDGKHEVEMGEIGEIYICGDLVADGYIDKEFNKDNKFTFFSGKRAYRTGDFAFIDENYNYVFAGRKDSQVKLRGYRIELEEIENVLLQMQGILQVAVVIEGESSENQSLVAFYTSEKEIPEETIKKHFKSILPQYMIPDVIVYRHTFPMNERGKIDKKNLKDDYFKEIDKRHICKIRNKTSEKILNILYELTGTNSIELEMELESLNISSLKYILLIVKIEDTFNIRFLDNEIMMFSKLKVCDLVNYIEQKEIME